MNLFDLEAVIRLDSSDFQKGIKNAESRGSAFATKLKSGLGTMAKVGGAALAAAGVAVVKFGSDAVKTGKEFDKSMSQVAATMGKSVDEIQDLRDFAMEMGATTVFSATQAADALNYMALAGYDTKKTMEMLPTVLNLAAAGNMDLARASDMVTDAESAMGLKSGEAEIMVNQMAKAASKSNTSVEQLGDAMLTIGGTAKFMSGGTERLSVVLGLLADNGIKGSEAGTHLRNMLMKLSAPSGAGKKALEELGVEVFDSSGKMRDMQFIIEDLGNAMDVLTDAQKIKYISDIFNARDVASVNALLNTSTERWNELGAAIHDSAGAAQKMAETQLDNLAGDITLFQSAMEGAKITLSNSLTPALRKFVQFGTKEIGKLDKAFQLKGIEGLADQFGKTLGELITKIAKAAPKILNAAKTFALSFFDTVSSTLTKKFPKLLRTVINLVKNLSKDLTKRIPDLLGGIGEIIGETIADIPNLLKLGVEIIKGLGKGILEGIPKLVQGVAKGFEKLFSGPLSDDVIDAIDELQNLREEISSVVSDTHEMFDKINKAEADSKMAEYWLGVFNDLKNKTKLTKEEQYLLNSAVEYLNKNVMPETEQIIQDETGKWNTNSDAIQRNINLIKNRAKADAYYDRIKENYAKIAEYEIKIEEGHGRLETLYSKKSNFEDRLENIKDLLKDYTDNITTLQDDSNWNAGTKAMQEYAKSIGVTQNNFESWNAVMETASNKQRELEGNLKDTNAEIAVATREVQTYETAVFGLESQIETFSKRASTYGAYTADGFIEGMKSKYPATAAAAKGLVNTALENMKSFAMIQSPSKRFRKEVGQMIGEGERLGLLDKIPAIKDASEKLIDASSVDSVRSGSFNYESAGGYKTKAADRKPIYIVLDSGELVGRTASKYDKALGVENAMMLRWEGVTA